MPVMVSYPGVYIQEIPSGQQTIGGVATSITAFVGRTYRGPVNQASQIFSFGDFQRQFGGLVNNYPLSFAVRDFFQNGGSQAIIVRIYGPYWLDFPVQPAEQAPVTQAASTVLAAVQDPSPANPPTVVSQDVANAALAAAATFAGSNFPQAYVAASWMADQASAWATAVSQATISLPQTTPILPLPTLLAQVGTQMVAGATAVVNAMESPQSFPQMGYAPSISTLAPASPPSSPPSPLLSSPPAPTEWPDQNSVVEVALAAAAAQIPGPAQDAAYLVANAVQAAYMAAPATLASPPDADYDALLDVAVDAAADVAAGVGALQAVSPAPPATVDSYLAAVVNAIIDAGDTNAQEAALIAANALLAAVLPAFQLQAVPTVPTAFQQLGTMYVNQLYSSSDPESPVMLAALPNSTAAIPLQVPTSFVAVAQAANSVAQAAWLAAVGQAGSPASPITQGVAVSTAASETSNYVKVNNPTLPQAAQAAQAVAMAVAGGVTSGPAAAAAAGSTAVAAAVAKALQLSTTNGAVVALQSAQTVAAAAWLGAFQAAPQGGPTASVEPALQKAMGPSPTPAAQAVFGLYLGSSALSAAVALSEGLVNATAGALPVLTLFAANAGEWANGSLTVTFNTTGITSAAVTALNLMPAPGNPPFGPGDLFNLVAGYTAPDGSTLSETWNTVSLRSDAGAQRIDRVLSNSILLQYFWPGYTPGTTYPTGAPPPLPVSGATGVAGLPAVPPAPAYGMAPQAGTAAATTSINAASAVAALQGTPSQPLQIEDYLQEQATHTGIYALDHVDQFDLMCIPPDTQIDTIPPAIPPQDPDDPWRMELYQTAAVYCQQKYALLILDPPSFWATKAAAGNTDQISIDDLGSYGTEGEYAAVYFPLLVEGNPLQNGQLGYFAPSGAIAGIMARTDAARGVWKAPAGINDGAISGTMGLEVKLSDGDSGMLNPQGINCVRTFPVYGNVVWGARTLKGADVLNNDYKYVPVRRLALYIEASLLRGMKWAVFEPNAEPLWASIRLTVGSFMNTLYRQGAFAGTKASDAYFVACDATTTSQTDIAQGIVNVTVGFAPLLPAEFVVITLQQIAGQTPA